MLWNKNSAITSRPKQRGTPAAFGTEKTKYCEQRLLCFLRIEQYFDEGNFNILILSIYYCFNVLPFYKIVSYLDNICDEQTSVMVKIVQKQ